ncbi:unnamed protein product [Rangifer tarandus platyrhynchus]|uniref:Uncharacterized protein n=2 Tax=Rangifer tarandus platyrhynchus TaxID=3082113 RepID=A0AC59ZX12_RANTA|nr:unnamed protein product [Rangifer tarandus platyrhynchus]
MRYNLAADLRAILEDENEAWKINKVPVTKIPWLDFRLWGSTAVKGSRFLQNLDHWTMCSQRPGELVLGRCFRVSVYTCHLGTSFTALNLLTGPSAFKLCKPLSILLPEPSS